MEERPEAAPCQIIGAFFEICHGDGTVELKVPVKKLSPAADLHRDDDIDLPFENDPDAVGKWKFLDAVPSEEQFLYGHKNSHFDACPDELYFLPCGDWFWVVAGWTKGWLYTAGGSPKHVYKNSYEIKQINGKKLMFVAMKDYNHESRGGVPSVWIYEKVSDRAFSRDEISIHDNIDLPFISDDRILGTWSVRDFVLDVSVFDTEKPSRPAEQLFFQQVEFKSDGNAACVNKKCSYTLQWTKGVLINKKNKTASALELKSIGGKEYLFIEWKSGDYTFGKRKPYWYVFTRA